MQKCRGKGLRRSKTKILEDLQMNYIYERLSKGSIALFAIASVAATANGGVPLNKVVSKPQVGAWYVNLNDAVFSIQYQF